MAEENTVQGTNSRGNQRGSNLTRQDRVRGGERSASMQRRDERGQFAGRKNEAAAASRGEQANQGNSPPRQGDGGAPGR